jgi:DNA-directed RNA polymerase specialized sigma24 family protein
VRAVVPASPARQVDGCLLGPIAGNGHSKHGNGHANGESSAVPPQRQNGPARNGDESPAINKYVLEDRHLIDRCLAGKAGAWSQLYNRFHGVLIISIRSIVGTTRADADLVDEIAARVWYALVSDDCALLARFDTERGCRFSTFLSLIAKTQVRLLFRTERRRKSREKIASKPEVEASSCGSLFSLLDDEFISTLSQAERDFYLNILIADGVGGADDKYSRNNAWQLRHRVRKKLFQYLK